MKVNKKSITTWIATDTARGIKVQLLINKDKHTLGSELFFETIEDVKNHCKGNIIFIQRKVVTTKSKHISK